MKNYSQFLVATLSALSLASPDWLDAAVTIADLEQLPLGFEYLDENSEPGSEEEADMVIQSGTPPISPIRPIPPIGPRPFYPSYPLTACELKAKDCRKCVNAKLHELHNRCLRGYCSRPPHGLTDEQVNKTCYDQSWNQTRGDNDACSRKRANCRANNVNQWYQPSCAPVEKESYPQICGFRWRPFSLE
jgi:hypothetical protein